MDQPSQMSSEDLEPAAPPVAEWRPGPCQVLAAARRSGCCKGRRVVLELFHAGIQLYCGLAFWSSFMVNVTTLPGEYPAPPVAAEMLPLGLAAFVVRMAVVTLFDRVDLEAWKLSRWQSA